MGCSTECKLCDNLIISDAVTFTGGVLTIDIPEGSYRNGCKYCIVIAQAIPDATTINAPVVITIGGVATPTYPLLDRCCRQVLASQISTRRRYSTRVVTNATGGNFKLLGCIQSNEAALPALPAPTTGA
jgi:hypothetical protein